MEPLPLPRVVALIGFMGAGKSTVGPLIAHELGVRFVDLDGLIVSEAGASVPEIFRSRGEPEFREIESLCLERVAATTVPVVLATGGGAPIAPRNRPFFTERARTFYLACSFAELMARTGQGDGRPLLAGGAREAERLFRSRLPVYEALGRRVDTAGKSPEEIARGILDLLKPETLPR